jgi:basic amino acid/polyamine antiporter, APA family
LHNPPNNLRRVLGIAFGLAVVTGSTIGSGILRTPGAIAGLLPDARWILGCWIAIGLYILLAASSYAELTTMLPKAGGAYNYIKRAFGNYAGFINGWFDFLCNAIAPAYFCIVLGEYSILIYPQFAQYQSLVALGFLTFFMLVNLPGVKSGSLTQKISSAIKIVLFLVLIIGCFAHEPAQTDYLPSYVLFGSFWVVLFKSLQLIMGTYDGWMSVSFFAEEDSNPSKNIPKSYLIGALTVAVLYVAINAAILYILPLHQIARSPLAAADAANVAFGAWGGKLMTAVAIFSLISILNAYMMIPSRILFGMGRDGYFPKFGTVVNRGGTPYYSLLLCYAFAFVLILLSSFEQLFGLATFMMTIVTGFAFASLIVLRKKEPDLPRPYKAWLYPISTGLALIVTVALFVGFAISDTFSLIVVLGIIAVSYILFKLFVSQKYHE